MTSVPSEYHQYLFKHNGVPVPNTSNNRYAENIYYVPFDVIKFNWSPWENNLLCDHQTGDKKINKIKITSCPNKYYANMIHLQCKHGQWHKYSIMYYVRSDTTITINFNSWAKNIAMIDHELIIG